MLQRARENWESWRTHSAEDWEPSPPPLWLLMLWLCGIVVLVSLIASLPVTRARAADGAIAAVSAQERIGREYFFDREVSSTLGNYSCADCHNPDPKLGFSDGRPVLVGAPQNNAPNGYLGNRNTMTLFNVGSKVDKLCWSDGRTKGLFTQCLTAVQDPLVLGMPSVQDSVNRVNRKDRYQRLAQLAYGKKQLTEAQLRSCMVEFLKTIRWDNLPADRLAAGLDVDLPPSALNGWKLFKKHCINCHLPENDWRDDQFHNIGIAVRSGGADLGRGAVTNNPADNYAFATPTLRGINRTQPYMHDGSLKTLADVVGFFAAGGRYHIRGTVYRDRAIDPTVAAITLDADQVEDLTAFLELGFQNEHYPVVERPQP